MTRLEYQGEKNGFHYLRLHHGGLDFSTDYRVPSDTARSEIELSYSQDSEQWISCILRDPGDGSPFMIETAPFNVRTARGPLFD